MYRRTVLRDPYPSTRVLVVPVQYVLGIFSTQVARLVRRCGPAALQTISESQSVCQSLSMGLGFGAVIGVDE